LPSSPCSYLNCTHTCLVHLAASRFCLAYFVYMYTPYLDMPFGWRHGDPDRSQPRKVCQDLIPKVMLRLNLVNFKAASTVLPRGSAPLPCRSYLRTAFVAANHRKPRLPVANSKLPGRTLNPSASPTTTQPPVEPDPQLAEPDISLEPPVQKDTRTPNSARNQFVVSGYR
jgi:hypothetical protein